MNKKSAENSEKTFKTYGVEEIEKLKSDINNANSQKAFNKIRNEINQIESYNQQVELQRMYREKLLECCCNETSDSAKKALLEQASSEFGADIKAITTKEGKYYIDVNTITTKNGIVLNNIDNIVVDTKNGVLSFNEVTKTTWANNSNTIINNLKNRIGELFKDKIITEEQRNLYLLQIEQLKRFNENLSSQTYSNTLLKIEQSLEDANSGLRRNIKSFEQPQSQTFSGIDTNHTIEIHHTEIVETAPNQCTVKYYDESGDIVAVINVNQEFNSIDPLQLFNYPTGEQGIRISKFGKDSAQNATDFLYYEWNGKEYVLKEGLLGKKPISTSKALCTGGPDNYLHIELDSPINKPRQEFFENLLNENNWLEDCLKGIDLNTANYEEVCTTLAKYISEHSELKAQIKELAENSKVVLNFGRDSAGNLYIGMNSVDVKNLDVVKISIGLRRNIYQGACAENTLRAIAGENLSGQTVFDIKFELVGEELRVGQFPPCSTCYGEVSLWRWKHPEYVKNKKRQMQTIN